MSVSSRWLRRLVLALLLAACPGTLAGQRAQEHWVATWGTAQEIYRAPPPQPNPAQQQAQAAAPTQPAVAPAPGFRGTRMFENQTVRMIVKASIGGQRARVKLTSAFGTPPVTIGAAHLALRREGSAIVPGTDRALTFGGKPSVTLMPGTVILSDPVDLAIPAQADLAVSLFLPANSGRPTAHSLGLHTTYVSRTGDFAGAAQIDADTTTRSYYWLDGVEVLAPADAATVVGFGDSITD